MVLENAIATNKRLWASGESNCDCVEKRKREGEGEIVKKPLFLTQLLDIFFIL